VDERVRVALLLSGRGLAGDDPMGAKSCDFFDMKGLLEVYVEELWGTSPHWEDSSPAPLRAGRSVAVTVGGSRIGFLGEAGPQMRAAFDLSEDLPVVVAELELELEGSVDSRRDFVFRPPPRFPAVHRDLAFVVDRDTRHEALSSALREAGGDLLADCRLFDVYAGAPLAANEKSLAFTLVFRSPERSLTNEEVDRSVDGIVRHLEKVAGARIR
jgi:phenylalanyl-tRNA synthetase beta chain